MIKSVQKREEGSLIPQGVSYSETALAFYIYVREGEEIRSVRLPKGVEKYER